MARRKDDGGHPIFWLLLGFLGGVAGTLGALLLLSAEVTGTGETLPADDAVLTGQPPPALDGAPPLGGGVVPPAGPVVRAPLPDQIPQPQGQPRFPEPSPPPAPAPKPAPRAAAPSSDAQIAEDAAASGMTARTR